MKNFKNDFDTLVEPLKQNTILLFDFETNLKITLQKLYQESGQINPKILPFSIKEIDNIIQKRKEFIKMSCKK